MTQKKTKTTTPEKKETKPDIGNTDAAPAGGTVEQPPEQPPLNMRVNHCRFAVVIDHDHETHEVVIIGTSKDVKLTKQWIEEQLKDGFTGYRAGEWNEMKDGSVARLFSGRDLYKKVQTTTVI